MGLFTQADMEWLSGPHVSLSWFGEFDLPSGYQYYHTGVERIEVEGKTWTGVSDPLHGQLVSVSAIEDPRFGQAAKVEIIIGGVTAEFFKSVKRDARDIEGRKAILRLGVFDPETHEIRLFKPLLPGKMSAPTLHRQAGVRFMGLSIESFWEAQNYPFGGRWSYSGQLAQYPGDKGLMYVGQEVSEQWE